MKVLTRISLSLVGFLSILSSYAEPGKGKDRENISEDGALQPKHRILPDSKESQIALHSLNRSPLQTECQTVAPWKPLRTQPLCSQIQDIFESPMIHDNPMVHPEAKQIKKILTERFEAQEFEIMAESKGSIRGKTTIQFQKQTVTLAFNLKEDGHLEYVIPPLGKPLSQIQFGTEGALNCLSLEMNLGLGTSHLDWVNATEDCGLAAEKKGSFIVELTNHLNTSHLIRESTAVDGATVHCRKENESPEADLRFLQLLKKGRTWYEGFGFYRYPLDSKYDVAKKRLQEVSLSSIEKEFKYQLRKKKKDVDPYHIHLINCLTELERLGQLYEKYKSEIPKNDTLASFLTWVWETKCDDYPALMGLLFQQPDSDSASTCGKRKIVDPDPAIFPWLKDYKDFIVMSKKMKIQYHYPQACAEVVY